MMRLAEKAFFPAKIPFPVLQVDTGFDFPEVLPAATAGCNGSACAWSSPRSRRRSPTASSSTTARPAATGSRSARCSTPSRRRASPPPSVADDATRRRPAPRSASTPTATSSANGTRRCSARSCGRCTTAASTLASTCGSSRCPTGPSSTSGTTSAKNEIEIPDIYFSHQRRVFERDGMLLTESEHNPLRAGEVAEERTVRFRTVGDLTLTGCVESAAATIPEIIDEISVARRHRARRDPWRRPLQRSRHGRPQARGLLLMAAAQHGPTAVRHRRLCRRRQVDPDRTAAARLQVDLRRPARGGRGHLDRPRLRLHRPGACSPMVCAPSVSRASRSMSPIATSPRPNRKFIIADTPGHVQYTRNMVTGASTADLGLVLVDARQGLTEQSRRHAVILSLLRVPHLVLCVNKMDLVDFSRGSFQRDPPGVHLVRDEARDPRPDRDPDLGA